jgi:hypothetical protein
MPISAVFHLTTTLRAKSSARNMIDCYGLFSGQNRVNGWDMRCRKDVDLARHCGKSGRLCVRLKTSVVEVGKN